jgi:hypothetical protein
VSCTLDLPPWLPVIISESARPFSVFGVNRGAIAMFALDSHKKRAAPTHGSLRLRGHMKEAKELEYIASNGPSPVKTAELHGAAFLFNRCVAGLSECLVTSSHWLAPMPYRLRRCRRGPNIWSLSSRCRSCILSAGLMALDFGSSS